MKTAAKATKATKITKQEKQARVGTGVFVFNAKGQVLLGKRKGSHGAGEWSLPGGHLEYFEPMYDCVLRELKEETDVDIVTNFRQIGFTEKFYPELGKHYITLFFACTTKQKPKLIEPEKCEGWKWFSLDKLPTPLFCGTKRMLDEIIIPEWEIDETKKANFSKKACCCSECCCGGDCSDNGPRK